MHVPSLAQTDTLQVLEIASLLCNFLHTPITLGLTIPQCHNSISTNATNIYPFCSLHKAANQIVQWIRTPKRTVPKKVKKCRNRGLLCLDKLVLGQRGGVWGEEMNTVGLNCEF